MLFPLPSEGPLHSGKAVHKVGELLLVRGDGRGLLPELLALP